MRVGISTVWFGERSQLICKDGLEKLSVPIYKYEEEGVVVNPDAKFVMLLKDNNSENIGFSRGNNAVIRSLLKPPFNSEWVWLLNDDTEVPEMTLRAIERILPELPKDVGVIGFQIRSMKEPDFIHHAGTGPCWPAGVHKTGSVKLRQCSVRTNEKWVTFASVLIRREVFEDIGLLDPNMFNYYSDSDFCFRARAAGWKVIYEPEFVIYHKIGSSQNPNPQQIRLIQADSIVFQNKWMSGKLFKDLEFELVT